MWITIEMHGFQVVRIISTAVSHQKRPVYSTYINLTLDLWSKSITITASSLSLHDKDKQHSRYIKLSKVLQFWSIS